MRIMDDLRPGAVAGARGDVLEIGFGTGRNLRHYSEAVESVWGIDPMVTEGVGPVQEMIRSQVAWTGELAGLVAADDRFEIVAPHPLNLLCIARRTPDGSPERANELTDDLIERANATGAALFTRTMLDDRSVLRISIGASSTTQHDVLAAWELLRSLAADQS